MIEILIGIIIVIFILYVIVRMIERIEWLEEDVKALEERVKALEYVQVGNTDEMIKDMGNDSSIYGRYYDGNYY